MNDFVFVKNKQGEVLGFWVKNSKEVSNRQTIELLLKKLFLPLSLLKEGYRVVPNTFDGRGGSFVMLGSLLAPGEKKAP